MLNYSVKYIYILYAYNLKDLLLPKNTSPAVLENFFFSNDNVENLELEN